MLSVVQILLAGALSGQDVKPGLHPEPQRLYAEVRCPGVPRSRIRVEVGQPDGEMGIGVEVWKETDGIGFIKSRSKPKLLASSITDIRLVRYRASHSYILEVSASTEQFPWTHILTFCLQDFRPKVLLSLWNHGDEYDRLSQGYILQLTRPNWTADPPKNARDGFWYERSLVFDQRVEKFRPSKWIELNGGPSPVRKTRHH